MGEGIESGSRFPTIAHQTVLRSVSFEGREREAREKTKIPARGVKPSVIANNQNREVGQQTAARGTY